MNTYEIMVLLDNREVKKGWDAAREQVKSVFTKYGAEVIAAKRWDERKLTYEIKKQKRATYLLAYVKLAAERVRDLRREMDLTEWVLRHAVLRVEAVPPEAFEPEKDFPDVRLGDEDRSEPVAAAAERSGGGDNKAGDAGRTSGEKASGEKMSGEAGEVTRG